MQCPKCGIEMRVVTHDRTDGSQVYLVQEFYCRNKACPDYNTLVSTFENMVYGGDKNG